MSLQQRVRAIGLVTGRAGAELEKMGPVTRREWILAILVVALSVIGLPWIAARG